MTPKIGIITGISGVGKTWLLEKVGATMSMQVLSASTLIREGLADAGDQATSHDDLRVRNIDANQAALLDAFNRRINTDAPLVVLDAHVIIDTPDGLSHIGLNVFRELDPDFMVFIKDEPRKIHLNRKRDEARSRPRRSIDVLTKHQEIAVKAARGISNNLNISIHFVNAGDDGALRKILSAEQEAQPDVRS